MEEDLSLSRLVRTVSNLDLGKTGAEKEMAAEIKKLLMPALRLAERREQQYEVALQRISAGESPKSLEVLRAAYEAGCLEEVLPAPHISTAEGLQAAREDAASTLKQVEEMEAAWLKGLRGREPRILKNAAYCRICETEVESKDRHDFRSCKCGHVFVDGGRDYIRRGWQGPGIYYEDRNEYEEPAGDPAQ